MFLSYLCNSILFITIISGGLKKNEAEGNIKNQKVQRKKTEQQKENT